MRDLRREAGGALKPNEMTRRHIRATLVVMTQCQIKPAGVATDTTTASQPDDNRRKWLGLGVLAVGMALIVLDGTIVGVALPRIITDIHLTLASAEWVNALYSVIFAALLLSFGKAGDIHGTARLFRAGVACFVAGSILAALSRSAAPLILARAVQGVGAAAVLPSSLSSVNELFRGRDRAMAFGIWGAVMASAAAIGPLAGGWLTTNWSWPLIFWVNVPLGIAIVAAAFVFLPARPPRARGRLDLVSLALSALACGGGVFAIIEGPTYGWWRTRTPFTVGSWQLAAEGSLSPIPLIGAAAAIALVIFLVRQRRVSDPLLNVSLFALPTFAWGNAAALAVAAGEFALVFVLPLYLIGDRGLTALGAGWVLAAMAAGAFVSGASARHLTRLLSAPGVVIVGLALEVVGVAGAAWAVHVEAEVVWIGVVLAVYGVGLGLASAQLTSTVLADVDPAASGQGSATQSTIRQLGSALGTAGAGTLIAQVLPQRLDDALAPLSVGPMGGGLAESVTQSAGAALPALSAKAQAGALGPQGEAIVEALRSGFAETVVVILAAATVCLIVGLIVAVRVRVVWRRA